MKRIIAMLLIMAMALAMVACSGEEPVETEVQIVTVYVEVTEEPTTEPVVETEAPTDSVRETEPERGPDKQLAANNVLMPDNMEFKDGEEYAAFGTPIARDEIVTVTFLYTLEDAPGGAWDVSEWGDGSVLAWVERNGKYYDFYIAGEGGVTAPEKCIRMFAMYENLKEINFNDCFFTSNTTSMKLMFHACSSLKEIDLSCFDTSNVTSMQQMFDYCANLRSVNVSSFDTSNVRFMNFMFYGCPELTRLDIRNFDLRSVEFYEGFMSDGAMLNGSPWIELFE